MSTARPARADRRADLGAPAAAGAHRLGFAASLVAIAAAASLMAGFAMRGGIGLSPDSDTYLTAARQLLLGHGFVVPTANGAITPLTHYPPLYPVLLALLARAGLGMLFAAQLLNLTTFAGSVMLAGIVFRHGQRLSRAASLVGTATVAVSVDLLQIHAMVWSEGPFILLMLIALLMLAQFVARPRIGCLIAAAVAVALAMLVRYAGLGLAAGFIAALLICGSRSAWRRIADVSLFVMVSGLPLGLWLIRNLACAGSMTDRQFALHLVSGDRAKRAVVALSQWLWSSRLDWLMWTGFGVVMILLVVACVSELNARSNDPESRPPPITGVLACFAVCYALFLVASTSFFDADIPLDARLLAPLHVAVLIGVFGALARSSLSETAGRWARRWPIILTSVAVVYVAGEGTRAIVWACDAPAHGVGYATRKWGDSDLLRYANQLPPDALIYSNAVAAIELNTGRTVSPIPRAVDPATLQPRPNLRRQLDAMARDMSARGGYIFYFTGLWRHRWIPDSQLQKQLKLKLVYSGRDGRVYFRARSAAVKEKITHRRARERKKLRAKHRATTRLAF